MSHTMKVWERIIETRLRDRVEISKQQYGFMPGKGTTDAMFALRMLMEKYRKGQRELHCVFMDLEKAYNRVPREELWYCMRKSGIVEKYEQLVQDMYEGSEMVMAKGHAYDNLYARLETKEGEKELYRLARQLWYCMRKSGIVEKYVQLV